MYGKPIAFNNSVFDITTSVYRYQKQKKMLGTDYIFNNFHFVIISFPTKKLLG